MRCAVALEERDMRSLTLAAFVAVGLSMPIRLDVNAATVTARPEDVGLSSDRLKRIGELMERLIAAKTFPGAVTLVARNGRVAHFEAHGLMDLDAKKPMQKDA